MPSSRANRQWPGVCVYAVACGILAWLPYGFARADGSVIDFPDPLSPHAGKVVLVDFWASWCVPCRRSFPWMNDMQSKYADEGLVIVAVNVDNDPQAAQRFLDEYPPDFQVWYDRDRALARRFEVVAMPSSFLLDTEGQVVERHLGFQVLRQDEYEAAIRAALGKE